MRITRVYTRTGDRGTTRLVGGQEVGKDDPRIEAYGTIDELNTIIGLARTFNGTSGAPAEAIARIDAALHQVQNDLFNLGADLATRPADRWPTMVQVQPEDVTRLESWCDAFNEELEPLREFILPGGGPTSAFLHQARTVCRRAERRICTLHALEPEVGELPIHYVNRLSDFLFVLGRWAAKQCGAPEPLWERPGERRPSRP
jgi:cob(I)alamin adenosyltransferase